MNGARTAVFVLGMHRAGTSVTARLLELAGVYLGEDLFAPQPGVNEKGFWENRHVVQFNEDLLLAVGSSWDDWLSLPEGWFGGEQYQWFPKQLRRLLRQQFGDRALWGVKDPRICRLLPLWQSTLTDVVDRVVYVLAIRHPAEVAASLTKRNGFPERKGYMLWLRHVLEAERRSRGMPRLICTYDQTLSQPGALYDGLKDRLSLERLTPRDQFIRDAENFLDSGLRHHRGTSTTGSEAVAQLASDVYETLSAVDGDLISHDKIDQCGAAYSLIEEQADPMLIAHIRSIAKARGAYHILWRRLHRLHTWKLTQPLRRIERSIRSLPLKETD